MRLMKPTLILASIALLAMMPPGRGAADDTCTQEGGWEGCPAITVDLEPLQAGGKTVTAGTPTAILFSPLEPGGPMHVIVADKGGDVVAHDLESGAATTLLSLDGVGSANPERGLLGLALAPDFPADGIDRRFYTYHLTPRTAEANAECDRLPPFNSRNLPEICAKGEQYGCGGSFHVTEWTLPPPNHLGPPHEALKKREVLSRVQPGEGHNAGHLLFGPDGMLYVSLGDGGGQMDPCSRGQDHSKVYSSILRLDVTADGAVAEGNPFIGKDGYDPLIWAYGFRNPWRMAFTPDGLDGVAGGVLLVGDTGQARYEEVDVVLPGLNYGWSVRDGTLNHPDKGEAPPSPEYTAPLFQYGDPKGKTAATGGFAIVGGVVASGDAAPELRGMYLFGDNVTKKMWALDLSASDLADATGWDGDAKVHKLKGASVAPTTFGRDAAGDVYVAGAGGKIFKIVSGG